MAVTGAIFKALTFNGESSRNYGVYITGSGVFNAPARDVEMITIAGRNGSFPLDHGRFENIEVTYPAGVFADNEEDFADAISEFRNMLCSAKGYCRLEDGYNPDEYRLAIYKSGLEVEPAMLKAGEFEITFECKPQRFLKSGETDVTMTSGGTITNPTRFDSSPLLMVKGNGLIAFNGYEIDVADVTYGDVELYDNKNASFGFDYVLGTDDYANSGDMIKITINPFMIIKQSRAQKIKSVTITTSESNGTPYTSTISDTQVQVGYNGSYFGFVKGTNNSKTLQLVCSVTSQTGSQTFQSTVDTTFTVAYNSVNDTITVTRQTTITQSMAYITVATAKYTLTAIVTGSKSVLGDPTMIDCETGEVYKTVSGSTVSLNGYIGIGAELPVLASGANTVTKSSTITELKIRPRWWKV